MPYELVAGDLGSKIVVTCLDSDTKAVLDLTGKTVQLRYKIDAGTLTTKTMAVQAPGTNGKAEYQFGASDLSAGTMEAEVRVQPGQSDQVTSRETLHVSVRSPLS